MGEGSVLQKAIEVGREGVAGGGEEEEAEEVVPALSGVERTVADVSLRLCTQRGCEGEGYRSGWVGRWCEGGSGCIPDSPIQHQTVERDVKTLFLLPLLERL